MSLPVLADDGPDPVLLAFFKELAGVPKAVQKRAEFFVFFAETIFPLLVQYRPRLAPAYHAGFGRPALEPVQLLAVLMLQFVERLPDRQAVEAMQYDLRWRLALHLRAGAAACDPSLLSVFRDRLLAGGHERLAFEAVLQLLVTEGWVAQRSKQRLDSTHICGLLAKMSRLECVRETIRLALEAVEERDVFPAEWATLWEGYVEGKIDPRSTTETLKQKVHEAGVDLQNILAWATQQGERGEQAEEIQLLRRVFGEHYERDAAGVLRSTRARPPGAVQNPHEPEAQWCTKSTTKAKEWVGYKTQVAETVRDENCQRGEPTANFLTAIVTQKAIASDKPGMTEVLAEQSRMGLAPPSTLYVDGAYVSGPILQQARDEDRAVHGPAPASPDRGKTFVVEAFDVDLAARSAVCPAQHRSTQCSRLEEASTGKVSFRFEWKGALCAACPQRAACVGPAQAHRTLTVSEHHDLLQARRREMQTETFKENQRRRNAIEGTQSELVRTYGLRQARYRGLIKVRLQNYLIGAACNLRRLVRRLAWETAQASRTVALPRAVPLN